MLNPRHIHNFLFDENPFPIVQFSTKLDPIQRFNLLYFVLDFRHVYFGDKTHCAVYEVKPNTEYLFRVRSQNVAGVSNL